MLLGFLKKLSAMVSMCPFKMQVLKPDGQDLCPSQPFHRLPCVDSVPPS